MSAPGPNALRVKIGTLATEHHQATDLPSVLRAAMKARGLTQIALATMAAPQWGLSPKGANEKLSRWLNGHDDPRWSALAELLAILRVDLVPAAHDSDVRTEPPAASSGHADSRGFAP